MVVSVASDQVAGVLVSTCRCLLVFPKCSLMLQFSNGERTVAKNGENNSNKIKELKNTINAKIWSIIISSLFTVVGYDLECPWLGHPTGTQDVVKEMEREGECGFNNTHYSGTHAGLIAGGKT